LRLRRDRVLGCKRYVGAWRDNEVVIRILIGGDGVGERCAEQEQRNRYGKRSRRRAGIVAAVDVRHLLAAIGGDDRAISARQQRRQGRRQRLAVRARSRDVADVVYGAQQHGTGVDERRRRQVHRVVPIAYGRSAAKIVGRVADRDVLAWLGRRGDDVDRLDREVGFARERCEGET